MFGMTEKDARAIAAEVGSAVASWRNAAGRFGITSDKVERMSSAFDHEDLKAATRG
jgi:serine/threonine-protein kinase HipA